jgi:pilus assembly protein Flp/PilA
MFKQTKKAQGMVEYAILLAGVALVAISSVSVLGQKTTDLIATTAFVLPGAQESSNGPIFVGKLVEYTPAVAGGTAADAIKVDLATILARTGENRLDTNMYDREWVLTFPDAIVHN